MPYSRLYRALSAAEVLSVGDPPCPPLKARGERVLGYLRQRRKREAERVEAAIAGVRNGFFGAPGDRDWSVWIIRDGRLERRLRNPTEHVCHSPDGFAWGYEGSGPAQLAFALALSVTGSPEVAARHYQRFKRDYVARLPQNRWWVADANDLFHVAVASDQAAAILRRIFP
jgi:hypothetical protein